MLLSDDSRQTRPIFAVLEGPRDPTTAAEIRAQVEALMELLREEDAAR